MLLTRRMASRMRGPEVPVSNAANRLVVQRLTRLKPDLLLQLERYGRQSLAQAALDRWMLPVIATWGFLFVGKNGEEIIGSAQIIRCLEDGDLYMDGFYIRPEHRRRGYGKALLSAVKQYLAREGFTRLLVTISPENVAALRLYKASNFYEVDCLPEFYGGGNNRLLYAARLSLREE